MLPDLSLLIALVVGLGALEGEPKGLAFTLAGVAASVAAGLALVRMAADRGIAAVQQNDLPGVGAALRWTSLWPLLGWLSCVNLFGWGSLVADAVPRVTWLGRYAVLFLPASVLFFAGWAARSRVEGAVRSARGGVGLAVSPVEAVRQHLRRNAIALLPFFALLAVFEGLYVLGEIGVPGVGRASRWVETVPVLMLLVSTSLLVVLSLFLPSLLRKVFHTVPLPAGELRALVERAARSIRLRFRDVVVWRTGGKVLNAMVVGLTGRTRVIFLTDGLLDRLPNEEVMAVFAHEAGHAKRHHLPLFLVVFFAFALLYETVGAEMLGWGVSRELLLVVQIALLWFGMIGWLSRQFEREADAYGADHATVALEDPGPVVLPGTTEPLPFGPSLMVRALDRIARLTGHTKSFRHGSIEERIRFVAAYGSDAETRRAYRRRRTNLSVGLLLFALAAVVTGTLQLPGQIRVAEGQFRWEESLESVEEAQRLEREQGPPAAAERWRSSFVRLAEAEEALGDTTSEWATRLRLEIAFARGHVALRGLRDRAAARRELERVLALSGSRDAVARFPAHVDLGRIAAGEGDLARARAHLEQARGLMPDESGTKGAFFRARVALLQEVIEAREGVPTARPALEQRARIRPYEGEEWEELARDAKEDLALLP